MPLVSNRWTVGVLTAIALVATAVAAASSSGSSPTTAATEPNVPVRPRTSPKPKPAAPKPAVTTAPLPKAPGPPIPPAGLIDWPATGTAYTDVLASIPLASGRASAVARARAAKASGLPRDGVFVSSAYQSLRAGYYVVFSGVFQSPDAASAALTTVHTRGFRDAYVARVTHG